MEMNDIMKDQKTMIALGVGLIIVIAVVALVFMGGGNKTHGGPIASGNGSGNGTSGNGTKPVEPTPQPEPQKVEVKTEVVGDKTTATKNKKLVIDFSGYTVYVTNCVKNGNYVLAKAAYFPTFKFDAVLYDIKNNKVLFVKDNKVYDANAKLTGDVNSCETTKEDLTKGLDLTNVKPVEDLMFA